MQESDAESTKSSGKIRTIKHKLFAQTPGKTEFQMSNSVM